MTSASVLAMLASAGLAVGLCMLIVIRFDLSARTERHRFERRFRREAAHLVQEAERVRRVQP